ncbi:lanthionine synthetase C family protein [Tenacibaculum xiamenense]|uniref:lanthionine synthetase C family protein n=1 Tax=Tenacibaculum xiamenense TaxID=1261553 RepID=UPI0038934DAF
MLGNINETVYLIYKEVQKSRKTDYCLHGTGGGQLLFQYIVKKLGLYDVNAVFEERMIEFLENFDKVNKVSFSSGVCGNIWLINYLSQQNVIDDLLVDIKNEIREIMETAFTFNKYGNYDFLHGSLGVLKVGYSCKKIVEADFVEDIANSILEGVQVSEKGYYYKNWKGIFKNIDTSKSVDFSLSHGLASVVIIFSKSRHKERKKIVSKVLQYIQSHKSKGNTLSLYPNFVGKDEPIIYDSRLAWCYGDLGIAYAFWQAGKAFDHKEWKEEGINIMLHASRRRNLKENKVVDAGFCHGTSGIAHLYNRIYKETKIKKFDETRNYWLEQTFLKLEKNKVDNFKSWQGDRGWVNNMGLLEGVSGIGLVLLGFLTDEVNDLNWDECLLLS